MQQRNGSIKDLTDGELNNAIYGEGIRKEKNFRVDPREYDKARARLRRLKMERKRREDESAKLMDQAETAETAETELKINDWSDVPFLSEEEIETGEIF